MRHLRTRRSRFPRLRRFVMRTRRGLGTGQRILGGAVLAGLSTYGAMRLGGRLLRPAVPVVRRLSPMLAEEMASLPKSAVNWGLGTGVIAGAGGIKNALEHSARRRYRRWIHG